MSIAQRTAGRFFTSVKNLAYNMLDNAGWDVIRTIFDKVKSGGELTPHEQTLVDYVQYRVLGRLSPTMEEHYLAAKRQMLLENAPLMKRLNRRLESLEDDRAQNFFIIACYVQRDDRQEAISEMYQNLVMFASLEDDDWEREVDILNFTTRSLEKWYNHIPADLREMVDMLLTEGGQVIEDLRTNVTKPLLARMRRFSAMSDALPFSWLTRS